MYFGIDSSATGTGLGAIWVKDGKTPILKASTVIKNAPGTGIGRACHIADKVIEFIEDNQAGCAPEGLCMEGYSYGSKFQLPTLVEVGTITRYSLMRANHRVLLASPACLKKAITGSGSAKKPALILQAYKKWGFELPDDNECDAVCLAVMAATYYGAYKFCDHDMRKAVGEIGLCN